MLNLSDLTSKFLIFPVSVIVDLKTLCHTELVGMFMIYRHTKFHTPFSSESLAITMKLKTKKKKKKTLARPSCCHFSFY
jgi:hypothetical protein